MNEQDPKPGVVIDVTPDPVNDAPGDSDRSQQADSDTISRDGRGRALALPVALVALLGVGAAAVVGFRYWSDMANDLAAMDARVQAAHSQQQQLQQSLTQATTALRAQENALGDQRNVLTQQRSAVDQARAAFEQQEQKLADENLRLQEREAELRAAVADVHRRVGRSGTQWMIAETEYLLRIANHRLILARDTDTARVALELADQRLRDTQDPGWAGVREQIARDLARLGSFETPDSAGLAARLAALIDEIPQLKIARATIGPERTLPERTDASAGERNWDTLLDDLWAGLKDTVRIRERDKPVQAMLAPEHQFFLYENLKLHLEAARLGLARSDQALFHDNLQVALDWLGRYFEAGDHTTAALRGALEEMLALDIHPALPDISQSLRALKVRQDLMDDIAPAGTESK